MNPINGITTGLGAIALIVSVGGSAAVDRGTGSAPKSPRISVLSYNIWHDQSDWPARFEFMMPTIQSLRPDVIGLQEVIQRETLPNQALTIANALGYEIFFSTVDPEDRPVRYGNAILTRHPIVEANMRKLRPFDDYRTAAHVVVEIDGVLVDVYNTHLHHTRDGGAIRAEQIADLLDFITETRRGEQVILVGDFNAASDWPEMQPVHALFEDTFALFVEDPLAREHTTLNDTLGLSQRRIDYVFLERVGLPIWVPTRCEIILNELSPQGIWASDHFGVLTEFKRARGW